MIASVQVLIGIRIEKTTVLEKLRTGDPGGAGLGMLIFSKFIYLPGETDNL